MSVDKGNERVSVTTYVPQYQREEWDEHATQLDMSKSEFVRSMVQAGRRGFEEGRSRDATPGVDGLRTVLQEELEREEQQFEDLLEQIEARLEGIITELREAGTIEQDVHGTLRWNES